MEVYLNLLTTALEYDYFICDYDVKYNIAIQNEMFESCCTLYPSELKILLKISLNKTIQRFNTYAIHYRMCKKTSTT